MNKSKWLFILRISTAVFLGLVLSSPKHSSTANEASRPNRATALPNTSASISSLSNTTETSSSPFADEMNPTIRAAIKEANDYGTSIWLETFSNLDDSATLLILPNGEFLHGEAEIPEEGILFNSYTDLNAATLGEIKAALQAINY